MLIDPNGTEFAQVTAHFHKTCPKYQMKSIHKIRNSHLWERYKNEKNKML